ncbi:MAG: NFACT family protein [Firmicutes bacterium]|nr:NFACT family protein [Bacillota bacterium]MBE3590600.1 NFACT family protein [Bacillota bacterium]
MIDGVFLRALRREIHDWREARVQQVRQPGERCLVLELYAPGRGEARLLIDAAERPRIHLTRQPWPNPPVPPAFCQLLRARLVGAQLADAVMEGLERVLALRFLGQDELGRAVSWWLYVEVMGRRSNAVLVDEDGRVVDALRRAAPGDNPVRPVWPGLRYEWPPRPSGWRDVVTMEPEEWRAWAERAAAASGGAGGVARTGADAASAVMAAAPGLGTVLARDVTRRAGVDPSASWEAISAEERSRVLDILAERLAAVRSEAFRPCRILAGGRTSAFAALDLQPEPGETVEFFPSPSALLETVTRETEAVRRRTEARARLLRIARAALERALRKRERQRAEWEEARAAEEYRLLGELLTAYLHQVPARAEAVVLPDWTRDQAPRTVPLDPRLSPAANAQRYFRRYQKAKRRRVELLPLLEATEAEAAALEDVVARLANLPPLDAATAGDAWEEILRRWDAALADAAGRLEELGLAGAGDVDGRSPSARPASPDADASPGAAPGRPRHYRSSDGWTLWVGRNSRQNDWLTLRFARPDDWWFHTKDIPGTHVLARPPEGWPPEEPPPPATLQEAALLAAFFSRARQSSNVPVDYTRRRYVRRIRGAGPGQVHYDHQRTVFVTPSPERLPPPLEEGDDAPSRA